MQNRITWRQLLAQMIADGAERQRICQQLGIHQMTLTRWANNISQPRPDLLRSFVQTLSPGHEELRTLILQDYPNLFSEDTTSQEPPSIPSPFYARIFQAHTSLPFQLRENSVSLLILQQMLMQFDPRRLGMMVFLARCNPPKKKCVRSLRQTLVRATGPWERLIEQQQMELQTVFFGIESLPGYTLSSGHPIAASYTQDSSFRAIASPTEKSGLALPLLLGDQTTGCLCLLSTQTQYFTQERINLAKQYANVLTTTLNQRDFYAMRDVDLRILPSRELQWQVLETFQQRFTGYLLQHTLSREEAETHVWQDIEADLLQSEPDDR